MTQEDIMKRKMHRAFALLAVVTVALLVFIGLYIDETRRVQETYRAQFNAALAHTSDSVSSYLEAEGDWDLRYRRIVSDMSGAASFGFLLKNLTEAQKVSVNELLSALLKYPVQMQEQERLEALKQTLDDLQANLDKGFDEADEIVAGLDLKGH